MLNVKAIKETLEKTPLCPGALIRTKGLAQEYCAVGALAKGVGASDTYLRMQGGGNVTAIFRDFEKGFVEKYGITSPEILSEFMHTNDKTPSILDRTKAVEVVVEDEQVSDIMKIVDDLINAVHNFEPVPESVNKHFNITEKV